VLQRSWESSGLICGMWNVHLMLAGGSYRGDFLGLVAVHFLILWGVNKVHPGPKGSVHIFSVCLGMLNKVENLSPYRIPTQCSHSLKTIMVNSIDLSFLSDFSFVPKTSTTTWVEPLCIFLGKTNSSSDKGDKLCFWVQKQLPHARFHVMQIVCTTSSSLTLLTGSWHTGPSVRFCGMFQMWASPHQFCRFPSHPKSTTPCHQMLDILMS